jgi:hypothetical protein
MPFSCPPFGYRAGSFGHRDVAEGGRPANCAEASMRQKQPTPGLIRTGPLPKLHMTN